MRAKKNTPEAKVHGHPENNFHTVEQPGFSTSFYIKGEEVKTLAAYLERQGMPVNKIDKTELGKLARKWFEEMMEQKKNEFSPSSEIDSEKA